MTPERMPKADATELALKKIGYNPPARRPVPEGHSVCARFCFSLPKRGLSRKALNVGPVDQMNIHCRSEYMASLGSHERSSRGVLLIRCPSRRKAE